jgi:hypothetical protein
MFVGVFGIPGDLGEGAQKVLGWEWSATHSELDQCSVDVMENHSKFHEDGHGLDHVRTIMLPHARHYRTGHGRLCNAVPLWYTGLARSQFER